MTINVLLWVHRCTKLPIDITKGELLTLLHFYIRIIDKRTDASL